MTLRSRVYPKKIYKYGYFKVFIFSFLYVIFFLSLFGALYYYANLQEKKVYASSNNDFAKEIKQLLNLKSEKYKSTAYDFSFWNEFINYMYVTKDEKWFNENIATVIKSYGMDYIAAYDESKELVIHKSSYKVETHEFIPVPALEFINYKKLVKFYLNVPEGILEVHGSTITTSDDSEKIKTPRGNFIITKLLDEDFFYDLKQISGAQIELADPNYENDTPGVISDLLEYVVDLKDYNGKVLHKLVFKRQSDISYDQTKNILLIIVLCFILATIFWLAFYKFSFYNAITLIRKILKDDDPDLIKGLNKYSLEFKEIGFLFLEREIQEQKLIKAKEKAEESDRLKSQFLANISHEIRTPMNAIIGFSDLLNTADLTEFSQREYLNIVKNSGRSLMMIIDDLVEMSKIDANLEEVVNQKINLPSFLEGVENSIRQNVPIEKDLKIVNIIPDKPFTTPIISDKIKLRQILHSLLDNSIKFTEEGEISFTYHIVEETQMIKFIVRDTGIGISENDKANIFKRFNRSSSDENINMVGLGLGLAISKAYVEMLNGEIWFNSEKNKGTSFYFTIPLIIHGQ